MIRNNVRIWVVSTHRKVKWIQRNPRICNSENSNSDKTRVLFWPLLRALAKAKAGSRASHSDLYGMGLISAIPYAQNVPLLLCHERFNDSEASLPVFFNHLVFLIPLSGNRTGIPSRWLNVIASREKKRGLVFRTNFVLAIPTAP
jgi:hypothetical protein